MGRSQTHQQDEVVWQTSGGQRLRALQWGKVVGGCSQEDGKEGVREAGPCVTLELPESVGSSPSRH